MRNRLARSRHLGFVGPILVALSLLLSATAQAQVPSDLPPLDLGGVVEKHVGIPMRDGVKLSAYLYFPAGQGPWPVIYEQRYADLTGEPTRKAFARLAAAGFVVCGENFRGTHRSEGDFVGYRALGWGKEQDGYDTVEWLAAQPWSTGKVGTFGSSQAGFAQNFLAVTQPPHLTCQYMIDTGLSLFHEGYRIGGAIKPKRFRGMGKQIKNEEDNLALLREWDRHPNYDDYWAAEDCTRHFDKMNVPCFSIGSWYDFMCTGSVQSYIGRQHRGGPASRGAQQLLIGPWPHGRDKDIHEVGQLKYPENARFPMEAHMVRWFDHYLKGVDNGVEREPTVRYYAMGALNEPGAPGNEWREASDWPVPAVETPYYLHDGGRLLVTAPTSAANGDGAFTEFLSDPAHPNEIPGTAFFPGATDASSFEAQAQVRTFSTGPLASPIEWTGLVKAEIVVSASTPDADVFVRVCDVYPDGRSILIADMIRRLRYRNGFEREELLEPGRAYSVSIPVGWMSQIFNAGHRIRVTVASTGDPFYEPQPNTGDAVSHEPPARMQTATMRVYHNQQQVSRIVAPQVRGK